MGCFYYVKIPSLSVEVRVILGIDFLPYMQKAKENASINN